MNLQEGILYISVQYKTAVHLCICGCGNKVVTPLTPSNWHLTFDGVSVSLSPSIGNWSFPCQTHYFITKNKIKFSFKWGKARIDDGRKREQRSLASYFKKKSKF